MATIVLLPGMDGTGTLFADFISSLPKGVEPIVIAYPPDQAMDYASLEAFVSAKLPARPFILLGESFSGPIAIGLAASPPAELRGVVLVCSFAKAPVPAFAGAFLSGLPLWRAPVRVAAAMLLGRFSSQMQRERLSVAMSSVAPAAWRSRLRAVFSVDVMARLKSVRVPLLYLRATRDRVVPRSAWVQIKGVLPSARLAELEGPHFLLQANPVESAAQVAAFAREVGFAL